MQEAIEFLDIMTKDEDFACIWNNTIGEHHEIIKFGDTEADISESRVHMIAVDHSKKTR